MFSGALVFAFPGLGVVTLVVLLSVGLFFAGIRSVSLAGQNRLAKGMRAVSAIAGVVTLILALAIFLFPGYGVLTLLVFASYGLIVYGLGRLYLAYTLKASVGWVRAMVVAVGVLDVVLSVAVIALPGLALLTLAAILALALLLVGAESLVSGAVGRTWLGNLVKAETAENKETPKT